MALRDLNPFARREPPAPSPALAGALADLDRLAAERPELGPAARGLAVVLRAAFRAPPPEIPVHAEPALLDAAWRAGVPAFRAGDAPPALDPADLRARALAIAEALRDANPHAAGFRRAVLDGRADLGAWALDALADRGEAVDEAAAALGLDPGLVRSVLRLALLPALAGLARALDGLRPEGLWTGGGCPNCGSPPVLGESRGLEQRRVWRCGLCASEWEGGRVRCPFCGEADHRKLRYKFAEGEQDRRRLSCCDSCGGALRVVSTLGAVSPPGLLVAELASVPLEFGEGGDV